MSSIEAVCDNATKFNDYNQKTQIKMLYKSYIPIISILVFYNDQWAGHQSYPRTSMADCNLIKKDEISEWNCF